MKKRIWIILAALVLVALMVVRLVSNKKKIDEKKAVTTDKNIEIPVNTVAAKQQEVKTSLVKTGVLIANHEASITATSAGTLVAVNFDLGTNVQKGQVIAQIDNALLQLNLEAAVLQQQKLQKDYDRYNKLLQGEATTEANLQDIKYNLDNATVKVNQIKKQIADNLIKAPVSGQIVAKSVEPGEYVSPGKQLGKVVDISKLKVDVQVSESDAYKISKGADVKITTDLYPQEVFTGKVIFVSQQGDAAHNYQIQVELPNSKTHPLKAGTFVYAEFVKNNQHQALQIPRTALVESMKNPYVYVIQNGKALSRKIAVGRELGANIEVVSGLQQGEQVVVNGQINLTDSTVVRVVK